MSETDAPVDPEQETPPAAEEGTDAGDAAKAPEGTKRPRARKPLAPPPPELLEGAVEAVLLAAGDVIRVERLRDLLGLPSVKPIRDALAKISTRWAAAGLAVELDEVAGGVRVVTRPDYAVYVERLARRPAGDKLTRTLLETLSIVAYKQPVGRAEVERIRGVQAGESLRGLLERQLIKVVGRSDQPGRPLLYGTTQRFLTLYGLKDLKDLPSAKDLRRL